MEINLGFLLALLLIVVPFWKICEKAGYSGWLSLLVMLPLINIGFLFFLAFADWPRDKESGQP
ncbi:heme/copper-type cytochrome/quinol oxidase subunit 4 [Litorivivens lipolytica]|uniref:Heme/copper-type cytochrome/quinol oxidase subunit 4 n=1 Tax=Litorivivens lipolytica TaxID=1524264 RepID=A0A7W4W755_9GAMM|nr:hypothetical protein [Litorivivens lipolytica]MBB3048746.1 heme/copper-type cytochrome/quinol oxidase subunit 4 [Litorivivens lipolytica]